MILCIHALLFLLVMEHNLIVLVLLKQNHNKMFASLKWQQLKLVIQDYLNSRSSYSRASQDEVIKVNGTGINYQEYTSRIEEMSNVYKMQFNTNRLTDEYDAQVRQSVYNSMVQEIVLKEVFDKTGLKVTSEELFDMIQGENISPMVRQFPLFADPETGVFSKARALNILKMLENVEAAPQDQRAEIERLHKYWLFWERSMKLQRIQDKYTALLTKAIVTNPIEAKEAYHSATENSDIVYAMQSYATIPDSLIKVSNSEIKKLYNQRKEQFKQVASRIVDYIAVEIRPSTDDYAKVSSTIEEIKNELATASDVADIVNDNSESPYEDVFVSAKALDADWASFVTTASIGDIDGPIFKDDSYHLVKLLDQKTGPDSVKVSHIFLASQTGEDQTPLADSLLTVLKDGGNFEELAAQYSIDQQSGSAGGELGWFTEPVALRSLGAEFKNTIFSAAVNQPLILKLPRGVQIIKVTERTESISKYKIAHIHLTVSHSSETYARLYNDLNQFLSKNNTSEEIEASAAEAGDTLVSNVRLTGADRTIGSINDSRQVVRWAFEKKNKGEISKIFECPNHLVVAVRKDVLKEGYQSIQSIAPLLSAEIRAKKKGEEIAKELKAKNLHSIQEYAQAMNSRIDTVKFISFNTPRISNIGLEPTLNAAVTYVPLNQLSEPVIGNNGVYIFSVFNRNKENRPYDEQAEIRALESQSYRIGYQAVQALIRDAKIEDNRIRFD
jgi:peptidyl-prolyl cis-trans isomerase D